MSFRRLVGFWVVSYHITFINHWPSYVVLYFDGLDPYGFDWISADRMHLFDGFFRGWQVVYAIGLLKILLGFLCWFVRLPLSLSLG